MDRHYHNDDLNDCAKSDLEDITAFAMQTPLPIPGSSDATARLPPKLAGAFAQHYGLPTRSLTSLHPLKSLLALPPIRERLWHKDYPRFGRMGVLNVATLRASGAAKFRPARIQSSSASARSRRPSVLYTVDFAPMVSTT